MFTPRQGKVLESWGPTLLVTTDARTVNAVSSNRIRRCVLKMHPNQGGLSQKHRSGPTSEKHLCESTHRRRNARTYVIIHRETLSPRGVKGIVPSSQPKPDLVVRASGPGHRAWNRGPGLELGGLAATSSGRVFKFKCRSRSSSWASQAVFHGLSSQSRVATVLDHSARELFDRTLLV